MARTHDPVDYDAIARRTSLTDFLRANPADAAEVAMFYAETGKPHLTVTRGEFRDTAMRYAAALRGFGIGPGDLVLVAYDDVLSLVHALWGLIGIGASPSIYVTPNERLFPEVYMANLGALVRDVGARALLTLDSLARDFAGKTPCEIIGFSAIEAALPAAVPDGFVPYECAPEDIAYVQTSSGTTGAQRCVPTSHRMVMRQVAAFARRMDIRQDDVMTNWMPLYHDGGLIMGSLLPIACEVPVALMSPLDWVRHPAILFQVIQQFGGTISNMPNFAFNHLARRVRDRDLEGISLAGVRGFVNGSERVYHTSFERFLERFAPVGVRPDQFGVAYGLAENTLMAAHTVSGAGIVLDRVDRTALEIEQVARPAAADDPGAVVNVCCGPPLDDVQIRILDEDDRDLPERRVGQIALQSPFLFKGYHRREDLNAALFRDGWLLTGDMGYIADGMLYVVGRLKDLIINGGKNLYPADIEEIAGAVPGVRPGRVAAFGVPDDVEGTELIAVVAETDAEDIEQKAEIDRGIRRAVTSRLSVTVTFVDVINERFVIKTSSGKTARSACRAKWLAARREAGA